ncbi:hypothetical protein B0H94_109150 [Salsuginibacillus halophilus]|uniref:Uncharacterized protein n=1 Tax=Salsuginibacillus halophilus TaxID=517424 RepID=A0A2P8HD06_9BACI|nr:hypothetical protein [Salsuginibacillus halophilus]PSL44088.1 hypothetical protein B0H94_109150 [Salsuginibacillus halophilus]
MKRWRYQASVVLAVALLMLALTVLPLESTGTASWFAWVWLLFAFVVIAGNVIALRAVRHRRSTVAVQRKQSVEQKRRQSLRD